MRGGEEGKTTLFCMSMSKINRLIVECGMDTNYRLGQVTSSPVVFGSEVARGRRAENAAQAVIGRQLAGVQEGM